MRKFLAPFVLLLLICNGLYAQRVKVNKYYDTLQLQPKEEYYIVSVIDSTVDGPYTFYYRTGAVQVKGQFGKGQKGRAFH